MRGVFREMAKLLRVYAAELLFKLSGIRIEIRGDHGLPLEIVGMQAKDDGRLVLVVRVP